MVPLLNKAIQCIRAWAQCAQARSKQLKVQNLRYREKKRGNTEDRACRSIDRLSNLIRSQVVQLTPIHQARWNSLGNIECCMNSCGLGTMVYQLNSPSGMPHTPTFWSSMWKYKETRFILRDLMIDLLAILTLTSQPALLKVSGTAK